jgi:hypothetical protein
MSIHRCSGFTKSGVRCKRKVKSLYCYQHKQKVQIKRKSKVKTKRKPKSEIKIKRKPKSEVKIKRKPKSEVKIKECVICCENKNKFFTCKCSNQVCFTCISNLTSFDCPFCRTCIKDNLKINLQTKINTNRTKMLNERMEGELERLRREYRNTSTSISRMINRSVRETQNPHIFIFEVINRLRRT